MRVRPFTAGSKGCLLANCQSATISGDHMTFLFSRPRLGVAAGTHDYYIETDTSSDTHAESDPRARKSCA